MKITAITMITNPIFREDPWRESIAQMAEVFDEVIVIYGDERDDLILDREFRFKEKVKWYFLNWPQPEWSYEELPKHLNLAMQKARQLGASWAVKLDIDTFIHEKDKNGIREVLERFYDMGIMAATFEKYQFFMVDRAYEKGKIPIALNLGYDIWYGKINEEYSDLCQPILKEGIGVSLVQANAADGIKEKMFEIPYGSKIPADKIKPTGFHCWNYDYSFKTEPRARELLYHFDRSHAKFWGRGYSGLSLEEITEESAFQDYMNIVKGRITKAYKKFKTEDHPIMLQPKIRNIGAEHFGHSLWGLIPIPQI